MTRLLATLLVLSFVAACDGASPAHKDVAPAEATCPVPPARGLGRAASPPEAYEHAIDEAARRGLTVWIEADLAARWLQGKSSFEIGVQRLADLASRPGVVGIKIADELGYEDGYQENPACVRDFLAASARALHQAAPGKLLLVDFVVPELGCTPRVAALTAMSSDCRVMARARYPALTLKEMDTIVSSGDIDAIDLSTDLLDDSTYRSWGTDRAQAQEAAWREVARRGWGAHVQLNARKALAHPGVYDLGTAAAESDASVFIDIPRREGARTVEIWAWRQQYHGQVQRLLDPGLAPNALWNALLERRRAGAQFTTSFSPSSVERDLPHDLDVMAQVFTGVYIAAGVG